MHNLTPLSGLFGGALIGLAAAALMLLTGRLAGVSGILGGLLQAMPADRGWRLAFVAGLIAAPLLAALAGAPLPRPAMTSNLALVAAGGLLVGFGSRMGNGCTSGHGVCGFARLSVRSIAATVDLHGDAPSSRWPSSVTVLEDSAMPLVLASFACGLIFGAGPADLRHDRARQGARLPRHLWRLGRDAGFRDGRRGRGRRDRLRAGAAAQRAGVRAEIFSGRSAATSMRRWWRARCCSGSAGAWSASVRGRRWSISRDSACRSSSLSSRWLLGMLGYEFWRRGAVVSRAIETSAIPSRADG